LLSYLLERPNICYIHTTYFFNLDGSLFNVKSLLLITSNQLFITKKKSPICVGTEVTTYTGYIYDISNSNVVFTEPPPVLSSTFDSIFKIASGKNNKGLKFHYKKMIRRESLPDIYTWKQKINHKRMVLVSVLGLFIENFRTLLN
jgi:hypothetical protein